MESDAFHRTRENPKCLRSGDIFLRPSGAAISRNVVCDFFRKLLKRRFYSSGDSPFDGGIAPVRLNVR
jgi:hypothetical protein